MMLGGFTHWSQEPVRPAPVDNQFQAWARAFAEPLGWTVTNRGNWVELERDGRKVECMSVMGVKEAIDAGLR